MKGKSFHYIFNKDRPTYPASNHGHKKDKSDLKELPFKLSEMVQNKEVILDKINQASQNKNEYYEERVKKKISYLNETGKYKEYSDHLQKNKYFIVSINFSKILSHREVGIFLDTLNVDLFRISGYDSVLEVVSEDTNDFFGELKNIILEDTAKVKSFFKKEDHDLNKLGLVNKFLFTIEDISLDSINRNTLNQNTETYANTRSLIKFNKSSFSREDLNLLRKIYDDFKTPNSTIKFDFIEDEDISYIACLVADMKKGFFDYVLLLFDSVISTQIFDGYTDLIELKSIDNIKIPENINDEDIKNIVCVVDSKVDNNNPLLNKIVHHIKTYDEHNSTHGTCVSTLACCGRITGNEVNHPIGQIFNIESLQETFIQIEDIVNTAINSGAKIINISQGVANYDLNDNEGISDVAKALDKALANKDILLVLSAGNFYGEMNSHADLVKEYSNINPPKDSISSISVGAKDNNNDVTLYSRKNNIDSTFSIGDYELCKSRLRDKKSPAFIEYGDNIVFNGDYWYKSKGTSLAAPLFCYNALRVLNHYGDISTNTIKALFINYSSQENLDYRSYPRKNNIYNRHTGWGEINIEELLNNDTTKINIIIDDYIAQNESKKYSLKLPDIGNKDEVIIKSTISYNPEVSYEYHLKYSKFNVSAQLWSESYQNTMNEIYGNDNMTEEEQDEIWKKWKKERGTINWINYFGNIQMWASNSTRISSYGAKYYRELQDGTVIKIEGHTRNNFKYIQKFSFVMTIDISNIEDPDNYIKSFNDLNNGILINLNDENTVINNINLKDEQFEIANSNRITIEDINGFEF